MVTKKKKPPAKKKPVKKTVAGKKKKGKTAEHELIKFGQCSLFNSSHAWGDGYDRAICSCGWESAASNNKLALVAIFAIHVQQHP